MSNGESERERERQGGGEGGEGDSDRWSMRRETDFTTGGGVRCRQGGGR